MGILGAYSAKPVIRSNNNPFIHWYLILYLGSFLLLKAIQVNQASSGTYILWLPTSGFSILIGLFAYPYSIPIIWLASLVDVLLINHQPIELSLLFQISTYTVAYGVLPAIFIRREKQFSSIQTVYNTLQLILLCIIASTLITSITTIQAFIGHQTSLTYFQIYVQTFLKEFLGSYAISFMVLSIIAFSHHRLRKISHLFRAQKQWPTKIKNARSHFVEISILVFIVVLGILFIQSIPDRQLLHYGILLLLPTTWLALRFGIAGTSVGLLMVIILVQFGQDFSNLDLVRSFEFQAAGSIYTIILTLLGTTIFVQRKIDSRLVASENKFDLLAESSLIGICEINSHRELEFTNARWIELTELPTERTYKADLLDFIHPEDHPILVGALVDVHLTKKPVDITFRTQKPDHSYIWLQGRLSLVEDPSTSEQNTFLTVIDVTGIKTEEEKLKGNETLLLAFLNGIIDPAWMKDKHGRYLAINDAMEKLHKVKRSDMIGKTDHEIWNPKSADLFIQTDQNVMQSKEPYIFETILSPNEPDRWFETVKTPILIDNQVYGIAGISREITERRVKDTALLESEHRLRALLNNIPDLAWMKDKQKNFLAVNGIFCTTFHVEAQAIFGNTGQTIFAEKIQLLLDQSDDEVLVLGRPKIIESVYVDESGFVTWYETIKMPMFNEKLEVIGLTGVARDITTRKRSEEAFQHRLETEKLIAQISNRLNQIRYDESESEINQILEQVARFIKADRCYFIQLADDFKSIKHIYSWRDTGIDDRQTYLFGEDWNKNSWIRDRLIDAKPVTIKRITDLPYAAKNEMEIAIRENITSAILIPVGIQGDEISSVLTMESVTKERDWSDSEEQVLKVISEMISTTLSRLSSEVRLRKTENRYRMLAEQISAVVYIDAMDEFSTGEYISPQIEDLTGYSAKEILANDSLFWQTVHPEDVERVLEENRLTNQTRQPFLAEYRLVKKSGEVVWVEDKAEIFEDDNGQEHWFGVIYDITNRKEIEKALKESQARFQDLFDHSPVALWEEDFSKVKKRIDQLKLQGVSDFREYLVNHPKEIRNLLMLIGVIDINQAALDLAKVQTKAELIDAKSSYSQLKPDDLFIEEILHLANGEMDFEVDGANDFIDGEVRYHQVQVMVVPGRENPYERVIVALTDITERKATEEKLIYLSTHDGLTGLYSRSYFETELERLQVSRQYPISLIMADIDYLKETNDQLGHAAGDQLMKLTAHVLKIAFRPEDIIARIGGDEFAILIPKTDEEAAVKMVQRLRHLIDAENQKSVRSIPFNLSIGVSTASQGDSLSECLKEADRLMYEDKVTHHEQS
jgi:diguanylate cyclase (GGDEF)-like protein/PAS domain S-box-containing protein